MSGVDRSGDVSIKGKVSRREEVKKAVGRSESPRTMTGPGCKVGEIDILSHTKHYFRPFFKLVEHYFNL